MKPENIVKIKSLKIEKLFDLFDYDIEFSVSNHILIITGANGFGKTQILNILYHLFNKKLFFFNTLVFKKISLELNDGHSIEITKSKNGFPDFRFFYNQKETNNSISLLNVHLIIGGFISLINVHLIKEQRLFREVRSKPPLSSISGLPDYDGSYAPHSKEKNKQTIMTKTIQVYSDELQTSISKNIQQSFSVSQKLDSSYPSRLIATKKKVSETEYNQKFKLLKEKQEKLTRNGLYHNPQKALAYSPDDAKALWVYLNDLEKKLAVFDTLVEKLELFTSILNKRRFTFKSIEIDQEKGFYFKTINNKELKLNQLSSGEQHEVVLLYELIFKTNPNILVLIDEPEISLHITWQKEFLKDLLKIIEIQQFQVIIATHAPAIINDRWDLVYNLQKNKE